MFGVNQVAMYAEDEVQSSLFDQIRVVSCLFGETDVPLNTEHSNARTYSIQDFYSFSVLENEFDGKTVEFHYTVNGTQYSDSIDVAFLNQTAKSLFPHPPDVSFDSNNYELNISSLDCDLSDWLWLESWTVNDNSWSVIEIIDKHDKGEAGIKDTIDDPQFCSTSVSLDESLYTNSSRYYYMVNTGNEGCDPGDDHGWDCDGDYAGLSFRTFKFGFLKDNTGMNTDNTKVQGTYAKHKFGNVYGYDELTSAFGTNTFLGNGIGEWSYPKSSPEFDESSGSGMYYCNDEGLLSYVSFYKGMVAQHGLYAATVNTSDEYDAVNLNFLNRKSSGLSESDLEGDYELHLIGKDEELNNVWSARWELSFNGKGSFAGELEYENTDVLSVTANATNGTYSVNANGSLTMTPDGGPTVDGQLSPNGHVFSISNCQSEDKALGVGVRTTYSDGPPTPQGIYHFVGINYDPDNEWETFLAKGEFDNSTSPGELSAEIFLNPDESKIGETINHDYTCKNGTLTITDEYLEGTLGDEGNIFVLTSTDDSNKLERELMIGMLTDDGEVSESTTQDDGGGGGGGCLMHPEAGFGYGWLLLLSVPTFLIVRTRKKEHRR